MALAMQEDFSEVVVIWLRLDRKTLDKQIHGRKQVRAEKTHTSGDADVGGVGQILCGPRVNLKGVGGL